MVTNLKVLYTSKDTQKTYRGLVSQVINLFGIPCRYLPKITSDEDNDPFGDSGFGTDADIRSNNYINDIYGEDVNIKYKDAIPMSCMLENSDFYNGTHNMFSKFGGLSNEDEIILQIEIETWRNRMERSGYMMEKPMEGDLISFDLAKAKNGRPQMFEIKYCNESKSYFQFGELMVFEMTLKTWDYSHETLETGDTQIDVLNTFQGDDEIVSDNKTIEVQKTKVTQWDPNDPFKPTE